jgi:hypothetical protein
MPNTIRHGEETGDDGEDAEDGKGDSVLRRTESLDEENFVGSP